MKNKLRKELLEKRLALSINEVENNSKEITKNVIKEIKDAQVIHIYYPFKNEVDTREIIQFCWENGIEVQIPRTDFKTKSLTNYIIKSFASLEKVKFGMLDPKTSNEIAFKAPEIIIVPGVGFDKNLNRMGYGGGFYDRFLKNSTAKKIAVSFAVQLIDKLPVEAHDIKMDMIITEIGKIN